jgi:hypothetical protein
VKKAHPFPTSTYGSDLVNGAVNADQAWNVVMTLATGKADPQGIRGALSQADQFIQASLAAHAF